MHGSGWTPAVSELYHSHIVTTRGKQYLCPGEEEVRASHHSLGAGSPRAPAVPPGSWAILFGCSLSLDVLSENHFISQTPLLSAVVARVGVTPAKSHGFHATSPLYF